MNSSLQLHHKLKPITDQYDQLKSALFTGINVHMPTHNPTGSDKNSKNYGDAAVFKYLTIFYITFFKDIDITCPK